MKSMKKILISLALAAAATVAHADTTPKVYHEVAVAPTNAQEAEIASLFDKWNAALATGNSATVTSMYDPAGVLKPTVSNVLRDSPAAIKDYFDKFLKMKPAGTINTRYIRMLGPDAAVDSGVYTFDLTTDGKKSKVQARYTFVYHKNAEGQWKIVSHHSSAMPEFVAR